MQDPVVDGGLANDDLSTHGGALEGGALEGGTGGAARRPSEATGSAKPWWLLCGTVLSEDPHSAA